MVQMKDTIKLRIKMKTKNFISHMVQMKGRIGHKNIKPIRILYIPHGSDESNIKRTTARPFLCLYIPHGSDERSIIFEHRISHVSFISHMVQMKAETVQRCVSGKSSFISHMVQMKANKQVQGVMDRYALYPTWFR